MRIGVAQISLVETVSGNARKILEVIQEAERQAVEILAFPETALSGYVFDDFLGYKTQETEKALQEIGERLKGGRLHVIVGTPTREQGRLHNSVVVLFPDGRRTQYHKRQLVGYEAGYFTAGTSPEIFEVGGARFGVLICRDQNSPELAHDLKRAGVRGIFLSSAHYYELVESRLKMEKNAALPIARAYENQLYVFKSNAVGTLKQRISYGNSMIVDPRGIVVQRAGERAEELLVYDADFGGPEPGW